MAEAKRIRALVIGGGIGGVAAAIALRQSGVEAVVFERAGQKETVGAAFSMWTNAMRALRQLGLDERVRAAGTEVERVQMTNWRCEPLAEWPIGELGRRIGAPTVCVRRADLHRELVRALDDEALVLGAECTGFAQDATGVTALFADGREERGDLLVGADGLTSVIRKELFGAEEPRRVGITTWRAIIDFDHELAPPGLFHMFWGRGTVFIFFRVGEGRLYWVAASRTPKDARADGGGKAEVIARHRTFCEPVTEMIAATDENAIGRNVIVDRKPVRPWLRGRVTLLGDAAHPMAPTQGQGACQALEDAAVLGRSFAADTDVLAALRSYDSRRTERTAKMVNRSRLFAEVGRLQSPLACAVRDRVMKMMLGGPGLKRTERELAYPF